MVHDLILTKENFKKWLEIMKKALYGADRSDDKKTWEILLKESMQKCRASWLRDRQNSSNEWRRNDVEGSRKYLW